MICLQDWFTKNAAPAEVSGLKTEGLKLQVELLPALVDNLVSEKRVHFRDKIDLEIEADLMNSYGAFVNVNATELQRLLSNTINNSAKSLPDNKGKIVVSVRKTATEIVLMIKDNGKGIPKHILGELGQMGVTHGKEGTQSGSGLGVYHAKKTIESFGGSFKIDSQEGAGTSIVMSLPMAPKALRGLQVINFTF